MKTIQEKLAILADAAKYDVACTSSGVNRKGQSGSLGNATACGICHSFSSDGRCISLLKVLLTNICVYDCQYCMNRRSNDIPRAAFTPQEIADLTMDFYKRNYIEGLFLSSAVIQNPDYTMELLYATLSLIRHTYHFNGYIHVKTIPGASPQLIYATGLLADRMSVNIELPSEQSLHLLAPDKTKDAILKPMGQLKSSIIQAKNELTRFRYAQKFVPAGQSTQMIVGATPENDKKIVTLAEGLYKKFDLKRVFYSAFVPVPTKNKFLSDIKTPLLREHRLYQADWLLRYYGFSANEIFDAQKDDLDLNMDPKCRWAIAHLDQFPVEINTATYEMLLRVPGIGVTSVKKIVKARKGCTLAFEHLKKMGIVLKRAQYFITCNGKMRDSFQISQESLEMTLGERKINEAYEQLDLTSLQSQPLICSMK